MASIAIVLAPAGILPLVVPDTNFFHGICFQAGNGAAVSTCTPLTHADTVSSPVAYKVARRAGLPNVTVALYAKCCSADFSPANSFASGLAIHSDGAFRTVASSSVSYPIHPACHAFCSSKPVSHQLAALPG